MTDFKEELSSYIRAKYPVIYIQSVEERRVEAECAATAKTLKMDMVIWSITRGFTTMDGEVIEAVQDPSQAIQTIGAAKSRKLYVLRDFHPFMDSTNPANILTIRAIRDLGKLLKNAPKDQTRSVIILSPKLVVPEELRADVAVIEWSLPDLNEIRQYAIDQSLDSPLLPQTIKDAVTPDVRMAAAQAALGLTLEEVQNCVSRSLVLKRTLDPSIIAREKKQAVARDGILEWIDPEATMDSIGGLDILKAWLVQREMAFSAEAKAYGLPPPKGMLIVGPAGTGKSYSVKAVAAKWKRPLLRLDVGRVFGSMMGESESNVRRAIKTAEAAAPCVFWIDEIEKAFASTGNGAADGGTSGRVFGSILTWMQEKTAPVFIAATSNDASVLPPELLRKGRFDEIFVIDLPTTKEREDIWKAMGRRYNKPAAVEYASLLAQISDLLTGAEIEAALVSAMFTAFSAGRETGWQEINDAVVNTIPLAKTAQEKIEALRKWAKGRAQPASTPESSAEGQRVVELI